MNARLRLRMARARLSLAIARGMETSNYQAALVAAIHAAAAEAVA